MTTEHEQYEDWSAAYVLNALEPAERAEYERHLSSCTQCQADVSQFAPLPGLLRQIEPAEAVDELSVARATKGAVQRVQARWHDMETDVRRWRTRALVAAAASVVLAALTVGSLVAATDSSSPTELAYESTALGTVEIEEQDWGTRFELDLVGLPSRPEYRLWTVDDTGEWQPVVSWPSPPEGLAKVAGGTALIPDQIDRLVITDVNDRDDVVLIAELSQN